MAVRSGAPLSRCATAPPDGGSDCDDAEGLLWHYLRRRQLGGHKFRRQHPVGPYVADFACLARRLVIELDGGQHMEQLAYDRARDEYLRERGFRVLRFWNDDVMRRMDDVLDAIAVALDG